MRRFYISFCLILFNLVSFGQASKTDSLYVEQPVTLETKTGNLYGTICLPNSSGPYPVALIIAGSGPTDRDCNNPMMKSNAYKMLAHEMAAAGIASLRYDKRGIAASAGAGKKERDLRFDDMIRDAEDWITLLKYDKRFDHISIIGHSEGSLIGMIAAATADKFISLAGPGEPADITLRKQLQSQPEPIKEKALPILDSLSAGFEVKTVAPMLFSLFRPSVQPYMLSWFKWDPRKEISKLKIPVMIIQGTTDLQVSVSDAENLSNALPSAQLVLIDQMNHVLKSASGSREENLKTYNNPDLPVEPVLTEKIIAFILNR